MEKNFYLEDILSQEGQLRKAIDGYKAASVMQKLKQLSERKLSKVVFSGMGSSHFCALGGDILLKQRGMDSKVISTGELIYYEKGCLNKDTALCLISQSGESAETRHLLELVEEDVFIIGVTNHEDSTLAKRADMAFLLNVSDEISVTTRTYLSSLVMVQLIAAAVCGEDPGAVLREFEDTVGKMGRYLADYPRETERLMEFCGKMDVVSLIGRGNALSSVRAGALFLREVCKFPSIDFDSAEFRHGPMEMVQEGFYAIVFAPSGKTQKLSLGLAADIGAKGGRVILITDESGYEEGVKQGIAVQVNILPVILPAAEEYASQILQILPVQLLANAIAEARGIPAGVFRWGSKVTAQE